MRKLAFALLVLATFWNVVIVAAVSLDARWALTRAAGGQFTEFPTAIRIIYGIEVFLMLAQILFAYLLLLRHGAWSRKSWLIAQLLIVLYLISTILNALSQSANERINAPCALIIAFAMYILVSRDKPIAELKSDSKRS